jgi:hypothetical protein
MDFWIQAGTPRSSGRHDPAASGLDEVIETVFPLETEDALIVWKATPVPLSYKYDLSVMMEDLLDLLDSLLGESSGEYSLTWPSNTFRAEWKVRWEDQRLTIEADWQSVVGGTEQVLNAAGRLDVSVKQFVAEWKRPLELIEDAIRSCGYSVDVLPDIERIQRVVRKIPGSGYLYRA